MKLFLYIAIITTFFGSIFAQEISTNVEIKEKNNQNINIEIFKEHYKLLQEENKNYRDTLEKTYDKYVTVAQETKKDLLQLIGIIGVIVSVIITIIGFLLKYYLERFTKEKMDTFIKNEASQIVQNKLDTLDSSLESYFEAQKLGIKTKSILYIKIGSNDESRLLERQGFSNVTVTDTIPNIITNTDAIIIDANDSAITEQQMESAITSLRGWEIPTILYTANRYNGSKLELLGFANTKFTLYTNLFSILNFSSENNTETRNTIS